MDNCCNLVRLFLSLYRIHLFLSNLTVLFSSVAVCISSTADECKQAPLKWHGPCLAVSPCDYTGISKSRCLSFRWLLLGKMSTSAKDVIHVQLLSFIRISIEYCLL